MTIPRITFREVAAGLEDWPAVLPSPPRTLQPVIVLGRGRSPGVPDLPPGAPRLGAALVLIHPGHDGEARVVLTERPRGELRHSGEISLPGGAVEPTDPTPEAAALREAAEEIGLRSEQADLRVLGRLGTVDVRVSGFQLVPVVATAARRPELRADPREVAAVLEVPLGRFVPGAPIETVEEELDGRLLRYGYFPVDGYRVWGATGRILGQLGALVAERIG